MKPIPSPKLWPQKTLIKTWKSSDVINSKKRCAMCTLVGLKYKNTLSLANVLPLGRMINAVAHCKKVC